MEVILPDDCGEIVLWHSLSWSCHSLKLGKSFWVMNALLEEVELGFTNSHLAVKSEKALSSIVESFEANWLEGEII